MKLQTSAPDHTLFSALATRHGGVEVAEKGEVGSDSEVGLTEVDKNGNLEDWVGFQMDELDLIPVEKPVEEVAGWQCEPTVEVVLEDEDFVGVQGGESLVHHGVLFDDRLLW